MLGHQAGLLNTSGVENTFIGSGAGALVTTDSDVIALGYSAGPTGPGFNNSLWLPSGLNVEGATGPITNMFGPMYCRTTGQMVFGAYFADLFSTTDQYFDVAYTEYLAIFNAAIVSSNISLGSSTGATGPTDTILFPYGGIYEVSYNPQYVNNSGSDTEIIMYLKSGIGNSTGPTGPLPTLANTGSNVTVPKKNGGVGGSVFPYFSITLTMATNGCLQFGNSITNAGAPNTIGALTLGPTGPAPACPSIISNIKRIA
jgi:hypothetical protein